MPGFMTLEEIVNQARTDSGLIDERLVRDGFEEDEGTADVDFVTYVNKRLSQLNPTGFVKCFFYQPVTAGTRVYTLDQRIGSIIYVNYNGVRLEKTSMNLLDVENTGWRTNSNGTPTKYFNDIPRQLGLYQTPNETDTLDPSDPAGTCKIEILAEAPAGGVYLRDDIPIDLNYNYHEALAIGAAIDAISAVMGTEQCKVPASVLQWKIEFVLQPQWDTYKKDIQGLAQHRQEAEHQRMRPVTLRNRFGYGRGKRVFGG